MLQEYRHTTTEHQCPQFQAVFFPPWHIFVNPWQKLKKYPWHNRQPVTCFDPKVTRDVTRDKNHQFSPLTLKVTRDINSKSYPWHAKNCHGPLFEELIWSSWTCTKVILSKKNFRACDAPKLFGGEHYFI